MNRRLPNTNSPEEVRQAFARIHVDTDGITQVAIGHWDAAYTHSLLTTGNPHNVTKTNVGLSNVDNVQQQPLDADLTAIAGLAGTTGFLKKTAADTWQLDVSTYLSAESDTLDSVTGRGNITSNAISVAGFTTGPDSNNFLIIEDIYYDLGNSQLYSNPGGAGDRLSSITTTTTVSLSQGAITEMVNGVKSYVAPGLKFAALQNPSGLYVRFDFGTSRTVDEATWYTNSSQTNGSWKWQGSNNGTDWVDIGSSFTLGGTAQVHTQLNGNTTSYRYYQLLGISGLISGIPYLYEIEFRIDNGGASYWIPGIQAYYTDGLTIQNLCLEPEGGNVGVEVTIPTARLHLPAGTTAATTAPLKLTSGTSLTTAEVGAIEFTTDDLHFSITTGAARKGFVFNDGANLTSGKLPVASTNGRLIDGPDNNATNWNTAYTRKLDYDTELKCLTSSF